MREQKKLGFVARTTDTCGKNTQHTLMSLRAPDAAKPPSPTLSSRSPYVRRSFSSMPVIRGMLLFEEQMKLKIHSTGFCLQRRFRHTHNAVKLAKQLTQSSWQNSQ